MTWLQLQLLTSLDKADVISELLNASGALAVTMQDAADQPVFEPEVGTTPLWQQTLVTGLFEATTDMNALLATLEQHLSPSEMASKRLETLEDQDWQRISMDNFQPMRFGTRLWIYPSWHEIPDHAGVNILLDPGLAFGTGTHPTTALCLEWLDAHPPHDQLVIDYGCGSGILGIAALKLGAKKVWAIDNDPQALEATRNNADNNSLVPQNLITVLPQDLEEVKADVLLANILAKPLIDLAPKFFNLLKTEGKIVLSGILEEQIPAICERYSQWFKLEPIRTKENWACVTGIAINPSTNR